MAQYTPNDDSDQRGRVLVIYASGREHAGVIANAIAVRLRSHGLRAEVGDAGCGMMPPPQDYDAVVLGSPVGFGSETRLIASYIRNYRDALAEVPAALFAVSASGTSRDCDPDGFLAELVRSTGWDADFTAAFAGRDCTDWTDVAQFADRIATELARSAVSADRTEPHVSPGT